MNKTEKNRKTVTKNHAKQRKGSFSDTIKAFMLIGIIVIFAAFVSCAVIFFHSYINRNDGMLTESNVEYSDIDENTKIDSGAESFFIADDTVLPDTSSEAPSGTAVSAQDQNVRNMNINSVAVTQKLPERGGTLVFVIDDGGNNLRELDPFLNIPFPLTIAVLPGLPNSAEAARRVRAAGKDVFLHQPMEAVGGQYPGPGAIYSGMSALEIREILSRNVAEVGPVTGINNHQGSLITKDREAVKIILDFCSEHGLLFLDSRTIAESVVPDVARQIGIKIAERNIFIDNEQDKSAMIRYIESGLARAQREGSSVMIGHVWSPDLAPLLSEKLPLYTEQGYTVRTVSDILR